MSKPIIEVKGISKCYKLGSIGAQTMRDEVEAFFARFKKNKPLDPTFAENSKLKTANSAAGRPAGLCEPASGSESATARRGGEQTKSRGSSMRLWSFPAVRGCSPRKPFDK
jgi:hypothetical protein